MGDFIIWQGGECPVDPDTVVEVKMTGCVEDMYVRRAGDLRWTHTNYSGDIIAYRVVEAPKPKVQIPEGFTPWNGGDCPVDPDTGVDVILADGTSCGSEAYYFDWRHVEGRSVNILAYRVDKPQTARDIQIGGDHYKKPSIQPWDVVDTWPIEQQVGFHRGNALKYVMRMGTKDESQREIRKAAHYLQKLSEVLEQKGGV